ncbi:MAG: amidohydrolase family protein [Rhodospirillales bacterium]
MTAPDATASQPRNCDLLIVGGCLVTVDGERRVLADGAIAVQDGKIAAVGSTREIEAAWRGSTRIDAAGGLLHPGYLDGHYHAGLHLIRGALPDDPTAAAGDGSAPGAFVRWLNALREEDEVAATRLAACELAMNGFTGFVEAGTAFAPDAVAEAATAVGIRVSVTDCMLWDLPSADPMPSQIPRAPCEAHHARAGLGGQLWRNDAGGLARGHVALYGLGSASDDLMREAKRLADRAGTVVHQHQSFMAEDAAHDRARFGKAALLHFAEADLIGPSSVFTHMNVLEEAEVEAVVESGMALVWHPGNALYYGITPTAPNRFPALQRRGTAIAFGTDVAKAFSFGDLGFLAYLASRAWGDYLPAEALIESYTLGGARAMGLAGELGALEVGRAADIVLRRADSPDVSPGFDPLRQLALIQRTGGVNTVVCDGRIVVRDGRPCQVDLAEALADAKASAHRMAERANLRPDPRWCPR